MEALKAVAVSNGAELARRCRAGDGAAWEEIVSTFSRRIFNLAYRFTSSVEAAEDLTQEVLSGFTKPSTNTTRNRAIWQIG